MHRKTFLSSNPGDVESAIGQTLWIVLDVEPSLLKGSEQFVRGEEAEFVNLTRTSSACRVGDLVVKIDARDRSVNLQTTGSSHANPMRLPRLLRNARGVEHTG